jgi:hypothetical protein
MNSSWYSKNQNGKGKDVPDFIDENRLLDLHKRLLDGDRVASAEVAQLLLVWMTREVSRLFPRTDVQIVCDGVTDAILEFCANPDRYDKTLGVPVHRFIGMAARRNVSNLVRAEVRRKNREQKFVGLADLPRNVELPADAGNVIQEEKLIEQRIERFMEFLKEPMDKKILQLKLTGERRTAEFARVMQIGHLPVSQQRREVKRAKDRIDKFLERHRGVAGEASE